MPHTRNVVRDALLDLVASLGSSMILIVVIVAGALIAGAWTTEALDSDLLSFTGITLMLLSVQIPLFFFAWRRLRRNREKGRPALPLLEGPVATGIGMGMAAGFGLSLVSVVYSLLVRLMLGENVVPQQLEFLERLLKSPAAMTVLTFIIAGIAPVCEELFFRGAIFNAARSAGLTKAGAGTSAALFAVVHFSPVLAPFYAFFALVMCWLMVRARTLAAPIAAHATMNGIACLAMILGVDA
jgi:membrane protease YdiL (CAAX protease family)